MAKKCRILCVDDHIDTGIMLKYLLGHADYEVEIADSVDAALSLATFGDFDLVILDKRFPDGTGIELCRRVKAISPETPVVFYTGDAYRMHREQAMDAGATAFVPKPEIDQLLSTVNELLTAADCGV